MRADHQVNRQSWNQLAALHGQDAYYDTEALCDGRSSLIEEEESALLRAVGTDLAGKRVLHFQCHIGFDSITFARRGARVTGLDFSDVALDRARATATRCEVEIEWVCADAADPPAYLSNSFDLVWATLGILCWIADLEAWMRSVSAMLVNGGRLVLIDGVPKPDRLTSGAEEQPHGDSFRRIIENGWDYATPSRVGPQIQFYHSLNTLITTAEQAGLRVISFEEHFSISTDLCLGLPKSDDGRYQRADSQAVLFTLIAERWGST